MGADYVGTWVSQSILTITIIDSTGNDSPTVGDLRITVKADGGLKNKDGTSLDSIDTSLLFIGSFGDKPGPFITSIRAADPEPILDAVFGNGDTITVRFSEATNEPFKGIDDQVTKTDLDDLFIFSQSIGDD